MGKRSDIQWTDATWNPWHGCIKVSDGCKFCYMYRDKERYGKDPTEVIRAKENTFNSPLHWYEPQRVFTCSWSDFFIENADEWRAEAWAIIKKTPHLTYQILTKRPERILQCLPADWGDGYPNVWLGVSVENQKNYMRVVDIFDIPAKIRFISAEPLLGPLDLFLNDSWNKSKKVSDLIHWVIVGGESGNDTGNYRYRECEGAWIHSVVVQCQNVGIPVFVKQFGTFLAKKEGYQNRHGGNIDEWPEHLQIRQFPYA